MFRCGVVAAFIDRRNISLKPEQIGKRREKVTTVMNVDKNGSWPQVLLIFLIGIFGMLVVSEAVPALPGIAREFHPPLASTIGWVMSMPALAAAVASLGVGWLVDRFGDRPIMLLGSVLVVSGDIGVTAVDEIQSLLAWRVAGGLGYVCMVVAAVTMMTRVTSGKQRTIALALWSTVIPASFIIASVYGIVASARFDWRAGFWAHAAGVVLLMVAGKLMLPQQDIDAKWPGRLSGLGAVFKTPWPFVLGASFAAAAFLQTGFVATLPHMLSSALGIEAQTVYSFNIVAMLCNVAGAFSFGLLYNRGVLAWQLGAVAALLCASAGAALIYAPTSLTVAIVLNCGLMAGLGILVGMWALLPAVAPSLNCLGATSGIITQITLVGVLFGPPAAFAAAGQGTGGQAIFLAVGVCISLIAWPVWLRSSRSGTAMFAH